MLKLEGEWAKGATAEGKTKYRLTTEMMGNYRLERDVSQGESMGEANALMGVMNSKEYQDGQKRMNEQLKKIEACSKLPSAQMGECMKAPGDELKVINAQMEALMKKGQASARPTFGCGELSIRVEGGKLSGDASACVGDTRSPITGGTVTAL
jgi:hypothetical protein